jgi:hypothetical protein
MYPSISFTDPIFSKKLIKAFRSDGLAVVTDVLTKAECNKYMDRIIRGFVKLGTGIDKDDLESTWTTYNLPPQTRPGLFQALVSNFPAVWSIRSHSNIQTIFKTLYDDLRGEEQDEFVVSGDGINIKPGFIGPFDNGRDWPHLDQTIPNDIFKCIQGQAVLTNTSASFVASPGSHLVFDKILKKLGVDSKTNWLKFTPDQIDQVRPIVLKEGGQWQVPILAPAGSFIVWASTTIHSAKLQNKETRPNTKDKYYGWRGVIYVSYRPKSEFSQAQISKRIGAFELNRTTNHWSTHWFGKRPGNRYLYLEKRHPEIESMLDNPLVVYEKVGIPNLTQEQNNLIGY